MPAHPAWPRFADRYRIERELGKGGMATVYLAEDLKHERQVALKVLRPHITAALGVERFLHEIRVAARLNHPHILTLIDSGEADAGPFYAMPYVSGGSLRERLNREKQLSLEEALRITRQIAVALDYAHAQSVVHRDIKPENVLFHEGEAMVADFGIALAFSAASPDRLTETGVSLGTPAYMSPEQCSGRHDLDRRTDVYSVGCVLYEMLAGHPPFLGATPQEILARHLIDPVPSLKAARSSVPDVIDRAVLKALAKVPIDRFPTAGELCDALERPVALESTLQQKSIVVLPFTNLSPDPANEYFSDGLTEEIITDLSKAQLLRVISRNSAMQLKGTSKDTKTIGRELGVQYVLQGSVRKEGNSLRVTAQFIDATNDANIWAEKYSGELQDVFDIQEKLSRTIVEALKVKLSPEEVRAIAQRPIENLQAYDCYLRARQELYHFTDESFEHALRLLRNGLEIAGENALLYALMGNIYVQYVNSLISADLKHLQQAEECTNKIFGLDPESPFGFWLRGAVCHKRGDVQGAVADLKHALVLDPSNPEALYWLAYAYRVSGKESAARPLVRKLVSIDPLTPYSYWALGWIELFEGRMAEAVEAFRRMYDLDRDNSFGQYGYAFALAAHGRRAEAGALFGRAFANAPKTFFGGYGLFMKLALEGNRTEAVRVVTPHMIAAARVDDHVSWMMAVGYALVDENDRALDWLENAVGLGFINYPWLSERDLLLKTIRVGPRYERLMAQVKERWEQFQT